MNSSIFKSRRSPRVAVLLAAIAMMGPAAIPAAEPSMAERLQRLEDKEAIHALLERYFEFQESRNFDAFANLFSKDGELILRRGTSSGGPAGIRASFSREPARANANADSRAAAARDMRHILSNAHIVVNGDTATAMSRWTLLAQGEDGRTRVGGSGRYEDKLVRENGEWKFQRRFLIRDLPVDPKEGATPAAPAR
jgi:ketosteroid isomerase-like protein